MKLEKLDVTLVLKPIDGVVMAYSLGVGRKHMLRAGTPFLEPEEAEFVCNVNSKYVNFLRSSLKLEKDKYGWCEDFIARSLAGIKGNYAVVTECVDVTGDEEAAEEVAKAFGALSGEVLASWAAFLCTAFVVRRSELEELMERWTPLTSLALQL